jgi:HlyD family secretion protein
MDIPRKGRTRARIIKVLSAVFASASLVAAGTVFLVRLKPAAPVVHRGSIWTGTVQRGSMVRVVRGAGVLVPQEMRWVTAAVEGRVERVLVQPGMAVQAETVLLVLSNGNLEKEALDANWQLSSAQAELTTRQAALENELLDMRVQLAKLEADYKQAKLQAEVDEKLFQDGLLSERNYRLSEAKVDHLEELRRIETERSQMRKLSQPAKLAVETARVAQAQAMHELKKRQLAGLEIRAGSAGVLQQWEKDVEIGRQVAPGKPLARLCNPHKLKAVLKVPEVQARDVQEGQATLIDTGGAAIPGTVVRIDPGAQEGTVAVEVALEGALPREARPELNVIGTIEIERLDDVLYVNRPANAQPDTAIRLFRIEGNRAKAVQVKLGSSSVSTVQILEGLKVGDDAILSDMSEWDAVDCVRLK